MRTPINSWHPDARLPDDADRMEWLLRRARRELTKLRPAAVPPRVVPIRREQP
jgi:hypothetical protein